MIPCGADLADPLQHHPSLKQTELGGGGEHWKESLGKEKTTSYMKKREYLPVSLIKELN